MGLVFWISANPVYCDIASFGSRGVLFGILRYYLFSLSNVRSWNLFGNTTSYFRTVGGFWDVVRHAQGVPF